MKKQRTYIVSSAQISVQEPFCAAGDFVEIPAGGGLYPCREPDYKAFVSPMASRRMSPILKRSIAVSKRALLDAGIACPDAIVAGTGLGCVSDTESFLLKMTEEGENLLNPSRFISSTPNTIASQIAMELECQGFNSTHVHDGFAFEGALQESIMMLGRGEVSNVLLCAADQTTPLLHSMVDRESIWKGLPCSEGAVCFILSNEVPVEGAVSIEDMLVCRDNPLRELERMMRENEISWDDIDCVVTSGFPGQELQYFPFIPEDKTVLTYKQYCGQWLTASAFGMLTCCSSLSAKDSARRRMLLCNHSGRTYSFIILCGLCTN